MKFRTQYTEPVINAEHGFPVTETDGSQNESVSQLVRRFANQGIVVPPVEFEPETQGDLAEMLAGLRDELTERDDFDLADAAIALAEAEQISSMLKEKLNSATTPAGSQKKEQEEPKSANTADVANGNAANKPQ